MRALVEARLHAVQAAVRATQQALAQCEQRRQDLLQALLTQQGALAVLQQLLQDMPVEAPRSPVETPELAGVLTDGPAADPCP